MKHFSNFLAMQCLLAARSRVALFWSFAYPVIMMLLMLTVFGRMNKADASGLDPRLATVTGVVVLTVMSGGIFALVNVLSADYQSGVYKRLMLTDLGPLQVVLALMLRQFIIIVLGECMVLLGAKVVFGVTPNGNFTAIAFLTAIGSILFCSIGFIVANLCARPPTAIAIANAIFLVMLFLSGSTFPRTFFPDWLGQAVKILPASHLFDLMEGQLYYGVGILQDAKSLWILLLMCLALFIAAVKTFKWK